MTRAPKHLRGRLKGLSQGLDRALLRVHEPILDQGLDRGAPVGHVCQCLYIFVRVHVLGTWSCYIIDLVHGRRASPWTATAHGIDGGRGRVHDQGHDEVLDQDSALVLDLGRAHGQVRVHGFVLCIRRLERELCASTKLWTWPMYFSMLRCACHVICESWCHIEVTPRERGRALAADEAADAGVRRSDLLRNDQPRPIGRGSYRSAMTFAALEQVTRWSPLWCTILKFNTPSQALIWNCSCRNNNVKSDCEGSSVLGLSRWKWRPKKLVNYNLFRPLRIKRPWSKWII